MKARLFLSGTPDRPFEFGELATIGRGHGNTFRLSATAVSTEHARIRFDPARGRYVLEDLGSLNGTRLDGVAVSRPEGLDRLHVIEFGGDGSEYVFQALDLSPAAPHAEGEEAPDDGSPAELAPAGTAVEQEMPSLPARLSEDPAAEPPAKPAAGEAPAAAAPAGTAVEQEMPALPAQLSGEPGAGPGEPAAAPPIAGTSPERELPSVPEELLAAREPEETIPVDVEAGEVEPGGEPQAASLAPPVWHRPEAGIRYHLRFDEPPGSLPVPLGPGTWVLGRARSADISIASPSVSRRHARFSIGERVTVLDLGSRNHTFVDGERVEDEVEVRPGARLRFGGLTATLLGGGPAE